MQGKVFLYSQGELHTRFMDIAERGILRLNFASESFTNGKIPIVVSSDW